MQFLLALSVLLSFALKRLNGAQLLAVESPVTKIVTLIEELKARIEADGQAEQASYDKYACWCEESLASKAKDISMSKDSIEGLQTEVVKLKGDLGAHGASIEQLKKDISANVASQKEATEIRSREATSYQEDKTESEQCVGALEAAIKVLASAGTGKTHFLETLQETQLLSVAAGVRSLLSRPAVIHSVPGDDLELVRRFVEHPEEFTTARSSGGFLSSAQIANNPFGDYAPQSTRVQGVLKSMYESFTGDLERANGEEATKQKAFEELMATKAAELKTLQETLTRQNMDEATKTKLVADNKASLDDTKAQLAADEEFFAVTKSSCKGKAGDWAERTRLRTEELRGMSKAIEILSSGDATSTFHNASTTLLQLKRRASRGGAAKAYKRLMTLATQYKSVDIANIAVLAKAAGHFDKVIAAIDSMIEVLRKEEAEDIEHRDRCEGSINKNSNDQGDLNYAIDKSTKEISRMEGDAKKVQEKVAALGADINSTRADIADLMQMRNTEHSDFLQALKDDTNAISLLEQAITTLTEFFRSNNIPMSMMQRKRSAAPPETSWSGSYEGRKGESEGVVAILSMIKEDLQMEIKTARSEDATAQLNYESDSKAMRDMLKAQMASLSVAEGELAELQAKIVDTEQHKEMKADDLEATAEQGKALYTDCSWVDTHFTTRREKRKAEMDGLNEAKSYLAGVDAGTEVA